MYNYCIEGLRVVNRIKELREAKGMTQVRLSIELEVSQETVSAYEKGKHYPSVDVLMKLAEIFDASIDYILGLSDVRRLSSSEYSTEELNLRTLFRSLSSKEKALTQAYMQGFKDNK